jgi:hypothetical protein
LFERFKEIEWSPGHARIHARPSCHFHGVMKYPAFDVGRAVDCHIQGEYAPIDAAADVSVARDDVTFDFAPGRQNQPIGAQRAMHLAMHMQLAFRFEMTRDREPVSDAR